MKNTFIKTAAKAHRCVARRPHPRLPEWYVFVVARLAPCAASFAAIFLKVFWGMLLIGTTISARAMDHDPMYSFTRAEVALGDSGYQTLALDGWYGGDKDRLWWQADAEWRTGKTTSSGIGAWYGHYFAPFWDVQIGARAEGKPDKANFLSLGVRGLAPYQYDTDIKLDMRDDGKWFVHGRFEQDLLMTNRFILLPWVAASVSGSDIDSTVRSGLYQLDLGLQARYEFSRKFAPFIEVSRTIHPRALAGGEPPSTRFYGGLRLLF